jgi:hypothetical protein
LNIPAGGEQKQDEEMRIIDFLSQQVQIAVDSLKSAYPNNKNGLDAVKEFLNEQGAESPWLKDFKDPDCYLTRKCAVKDDALDTISFRQISPYSPKSCPSMGLMLFSLNDLQRTNCTSSESFLPPQNESL